MPVTPKMCRYVGLDMLQLNHYDMIDIIAIDEMMCKDRDCANQLLNLQKEIIKGDYRVRILPYENCIEVITENYCADFMTDPTFRYMRTVYFDNAEDVEFFRYERDYVDCYAVALIDEETFQKYSALDDMLRDDDM